MAATAVAVPVAVPVTAYNDTNIDHYYNTLYRRFTANPIEENANMLIGLIIQASPSKQRAILEHIEQAYVQSNANANYSNTHKTKIQHGIVYIIENVKRMLTSENPSNKPEKIALANNYIRQHPIRMNVATSNVPSQIGPVIAHVPPMPHATIDPQFNVGIKDTNSIIDFIHNSLKSEIFYPTLDRAYKQHANVQPYRAQLAQIDNSSAVKRPHRAIRELLAASIPLRNLYTVAEFLRSYIDFHHDFKGRSFTLIQEARHIFERMILVGIGSQVIYRAAKVPININTWYVEWINRLEGMYTQGKTDVSQSRCQELMNDLVDELLLFVGDPRNVDGADNVINWIPLTTMEAQRDNVYYVHNAAADPTDAPMSEYTNEEGELEPIEEGELNPAVINRLRQYLNNNGVSHTFVESIKTSFYSSFLQNKTWNSQGNEFGMLNVILPIADWDAAPGVKKADYIPPMDAYMTSAEPLPIFGGIVNVHVDNNILTCEGIGPKTALHIPGPQKLDLNAILKTAGQDILRVKKGNVGKQERTRVLEGIDPDDPALKLYYLPLLKTWTDYVQVRMLSHLNRSTDPAQPAIAMCTVDICCEITARMYGLPFVMLAGNRTITLYCYDLRANAKFAETQKDNRIQTMASVLAKRREMRATVSNWYTYITTLFENLEDYMTDPALYFSILAFKRKAEEYKKHMNRNLDDIDNVAKELDSGIISVRTQQLLQGFPTTLEKSFRLSTNSEQISIDFDETYTMLQGIIQQIRSDPKTYDAWQITRVKIDQDIVNICRTDMDSYRRYAYNIGIYVISYLKEYSDINAKIKRLATIQEECIKATLQSTVVNGFIAESFVGVSDMQKAFIESSVSYREWETKYKALLYAKEHAWKSNDKKSESALARSDVMNLYHVLLNMDDVFYNTMKDTMLIALILLKINGNMEPFVYDIDYSYIKTQAPPPFAPKAATRESSRRTAAAAAAVSGNPLKRKQPFNSNKPPNRKEENDAQNMGLLQESEYFLNWNELYTSTKSHTLSMIDPENALVGLIKRIMKYMKSFLTIDESIVYKEINEKIIVIGRTSCLCSTDPTGGSKRAKCAQTCPILYGNNNTKRNMNSKKPKIGGYKIDTRKRIRKTTSKRLYKGRTYRRSTCKRSTYKQSRHLKRTQKKR